MHLQFIYKLIILKISYIHEKTPTFKEYFIKLQIVIQCIDIL